ncbi:glycerophosphodiester phosphodiesterase [Zobellia amurskyensis]|uniref:Glycerophosphodiester phosphodiesterase n=1 Tax=Zobellia amurskyensis TaxID=248905 RepID=A0A7X2ZR88_9FLAO|nr:glycerophosphodiester phosphodiesterase family protein [Zobellia amurskyensis]MUH34932.1 glycerophosphodiester phosphodiesterase [Zobellia amurskyensis]
MENNKPLIIGHRGAMGHETENTIASIEKAMEMGVDMLEIDVFKIKSGEIVVFHDDTIERLTDGEGEIEDYTLAELKALTVEGGHKIPTLQEILDVMGGKTQLNIELKGTNTATDVNKMMEAEVKAGNWKLDDFIISSFEWDELRTMRKANSNVRIAILIGKDPLDALAVGKELNAEAINPSFKSLTAENNLKIKEAGFKIYPWTVNEPQDILQMKRFGVDGIITNYPERIN